MRKAFLILIFFNFFIEFSFGQISKGGYPLEIPLLKSGTIPYVVMPTVNNSKLTKESEIESDSLLKPFRFAHGFKVELSPLNSGNWIKYNHETSIWILKIRSVEAKSLNLIFSSFHIPKGSRLFIYNPKFNHFLGAFTSDNNSESGKFAVSPVAGDEIIIQYEVPTQFKNQSDFIITEVNHDFAGILKYSDRRPLGIKAGDCNLDINCPINKYWNDLKNSVCRIIVNGKEICTGTLLNNTSENMKPFVISAAHCYNKWEFAQTSIFAFNYESPFCASLDGDPSNTISGAIMKAQFDSLDFALVQLNTIPPPDFRPYYAGWDNSGTFPDSSATIHHPQGDIKKASIDKNQPTISNFNSNYLKNGFLRITRWESGVTENGSSGGGLFGSKKNLIGTLTGGKAYCGNPIDDYFSNFALSWNYKSDSSKQLKYWLDPLKSGSKSMNGRQFYKDTNNCFSYTNLTSSDNYQKIKITGTGNFAGYWGGSNNLNIKEFVEKYTIKGTKSISGLSMGIAKIVDKADGIDSEIKIKIYNGTEFPETEIYSSSIKIKILVSDAMNFIPFNQSVKPGNTFFVGFELSNIQPMDSFYVYQSARKPTDENFLYYKQDDYWKNLKNLNPSTNPIANVFELVVCGLDSINTDSSVVPVSDKLRIYPNPSRSVIYIDSDSEIILEGLSVFNLLGRKINVKLTSLSAKKASVDLSGNVPGVYFVQMKYKTHLVSQKFSFFPH